MTTPGLVLLALLGGSDVLAPVSLQGLAFKAPTGWHSGTPDEHTLEWTEAGEGAKMAVSVYPLERLQPAPGCMKKLLDAVGAAGFERITLGTQPAAKRVSNDFVGEGEAAKVEANRITTTTVLGCNGKVKWVLTWSAMTREATRFGPMLRRILESIAYGKAP